MITFFEAIGFITCSISTITILILFAQWVIGRAMNLYRDMLDIDLFWAFKKHRKEFENWYNETLDSKIGKHVENNESTK